MPYQSRILRIVMVAMQRNLSFFRTSHGYNSLEGSNRKTGSDEFHLPGNDFRQGYSETSILLQTN